jgi:DNA-3-methyladenine glycosylase II
MPGETQTDAKYGCSGGARPNGLGLRMATRIRLAPPPGPRDENAEGHCEDLRWAATSKRLGGQQVRQPLSRGMLRNFAAVYRLGGMTGGLRRVRYDHVRACRELAEADKALARLSQRAGAFALRIKPTHSTFEALLESIVYQQLHGRAALAIHSRVLALFPDERPTPELLLRLPDATLRAAGLSANKLLAIHDLAEKCASGSVPSLAKLHRMSDDEVCERLTAVRGIGVWTVQMLLIFRMGRPNVLPVADYGVRKGFALTFGKLRPGMPCGLKDLPDAAAIERRAERWQPWRSVASWYLWRACDLAARAETQSIAGKR